MMMMRLNKLSEFNRTESHGFEGKNAMNRKIQGI